MNKIKVIDLLNMISKGEKAPKKIKINNFIYEYRGCMYCTEKANYQDIEDYLFGKWNFNILNEEVEILDEPKDNSIERLDIEEDAMNRNERFIRKEDHKIVNLSVADYELAKKINELIDKVNKLI